MYRTLRIHNDAKFKLLQELCALPRISDCLVLYIRKLLSPLDCVLDIKTPTLNGKR